MRKDVVILHRLNGKPVAEKFWAEPSDEFERAEDGYYSVRDAAWKFLIDQKIEYLPLDLFEIFERMGCLCIGFSSARETIEPIIGSEYFGEGVDCFTIFDGDKTVVVYNESLPQERLNYSLAHELGHIVLRHDQNTPFRYDAEADMFAARILMPTAVLKACKVTSAEEIAQICDVSMAAARKRWDRMKTLNDRQRYLSSPLEKQVLAQFADFI